MLTVIINYSTGIISLPTSRKPHSILLQSTE